MYEYEQIVRSVFGDRFDRMLKRQSRRLWSELPEDATPYYVWRHMSDQTRAYYRKSWSKYRLKMTPKERQDRLWNDLMEWYEEAYAQYQEVNFDPDTMSGGHDDY